MGGEKSGCKNRQKWYNKSGIIKVSHKIGESAKTAFDINKYQIVDNPNSVSELKKFIEDIGYSDIRGIEKLSDGEAAKTIIAAIKELSDEYNKNFSCIVFAELGTDQKDITVAETFERTLYLNSKLMNRPDALKELLDMWSKSGYIPKGCNNLQYFGKHEYYHLLTQYQIDNQK